MDLGLLVAAMLDIGASYAYLSFVCCIITYIPYTIT